MKIVFSVNGVPIRVTEERLKHIYGYHPELDNAEDLIIDTINNPDLVQKGDTGTLLAVKKFEKTPVANNKYLVVVYKEVSQSDGFVLTAYYQSVLRRRLIIWKS